MMTENNGVQESGGTFEQRLQKVQEIIDRIEGNALPLEESVQAFEQGMKMIGAMEKELTELNRRITVYREEQNGATETPFEPDL